MAKKALLVGINNYPDTRNDLPSCVNDARNLGRFLQGTAFGFNDVRTLVNSEATVNAVEDGLKWLFADTKSDDQLVFFYSGHGTTSAKSGVFQEYLCLYDNLFQDDRLSALTQNLQDGILTCIFDSCYSGGMDKILMTFDKEGKPFQLIHGMQVPVKVWQISPEEEAHELRARKNAIGYKGFGCKVINTPSIDKQKEFKDKVQSDESRDVQMKGILVAASQEGETAAASSANTDGMSAFTYCFLDTLSKAAKGKTLNEIVKDATLELVTLGFRQTPCVKYPSTSVELDARPFLSISSVAAVEPNKEENSRNETVDNGLVATVVAEILRLSGYVKSFSVPCPAIESGNRMNHKFLDSDLARIIPVVVCVANAISKSSEGASKFRLSVGGGVSIPGVGTQLGISVSDKNWADDIARIAPVVFEVLEALSKSQAASKSEVSVGGGVSMGFFGPQSDFSISDKNLAVDLAKIVPVVLQVIAAFSKTPQIPDKDFFRDLTDVIPLVIQVARLLA